MKIRESGMPEEIMWATFFDVVTILEKMHVNQSVCNLIEVGCGYGTFTIDAAKRISGKVIAFDIEQDMIDFTLIKMLQSGVSNIELIHSDIFAQDMGIKAGSIDYVMLFNILHYENPLELLDISKKVLAKGGKVGVIHWRNDIETPRGPAKSIRPKPEDCIKWAEHAGFKIHTYPMILEPYHYGLILEKK